MREGKRKESNNGKKKEKEKKDRKGKGQKRRVESITRFQFDPNLSNAL